MDSLPLSVNPPIYGRRRQQQVVTAILGGAFVLVLINLVSQYLSTTSAGCDASTRKRRRSPAI